MSDLTDAVRAWMNGGQFVTLDDVEIYYRSSGPAQQRLPWLVQNSFAGTTALRG